MSRTALHFSRTIAVLVMLPALMGICRPLSAQQLLWDVDFKFGFDNREYASLDIAPSETIFGAVLSPKVGFGFGEGHALYAGVDAAKYFGRTAPELSLEARSMPGLSRAAGSRDIILWPSMTTVISSTPTLAEPF